jgi:hypothetical protein
MCSKTKGSVNPQHLTAEEKEQMGLRGLLPYAISSQDKQKLRVIENIRRKESSIEKYIFLSALQDRNERLFYRDGDGLSSGIVAGHLYAHCGRSVPAVFAHLQD